MERIVVVEYMGTGQQTSKHIGDSGGDITVTR